MALTRLFVHDTFYDATDGFTYTPGMRLTLDNTTQSARITRLQNSGVISTDETIDPAGVAITGGTIDNAVIGGTTPLAGTFTAIDMTGSAPNMDITDTDGTYGASVRMSTDQFRIGALDAGGSFNGSFIVADIDASGADNIRLLTDGAEALRINDNQQVLIGRTSAVGSELLSVDGGALIDGPISFPRDGVTISSGSITVASTLVSVDTEGGASSDDLDTITTGADGQIAIIRPATNTEDVVVRDASVSGGNIRLSGSASCTLAHRFDKIVLIYDQVPAAWCELSRSINI
jgi:hypothetical protein